MNIEQRIAAAVAALPPEELSDPPVTCLRGVRGLPSGRLAEIVATAWRESPTKLPDDGELLNRLFGTAWDDGLAAVGLCATTVGATPAEALELALTWVERLDDVVTADAIGWLVLGPAVAADPRRMDDVDAALARHELPEARRAFAAMGLAWTPEKLEGPAAAGIREQRGQRQVRMVDAADPALLGPLVRRLIRDPSAAVQKALRRVVRAWADADPTSLVAWAPTVPGGLPKLLGNEVDRVRRRR